MDPIYVTGHRNPDTDSIVSAMAYAALQNALGNREYVAARLGHISDETKLVLDPSALSRRSASRPCAHRCRIWTTTRRPRSRAR